MRDAYGEFYFYNGISEGRKHEQNKKEQARDEDRKSEAERQPNDISFLGIKLSYAKAFGIAFLIIFLLLFFPGIGVSSSGAKNQLKAESNEQGNPKEDTKIS